MSLYPEDFATATLKEFLGWRAENRAWGKELRLKNYALVNSRFAKEISQEDYLENRKLTNEDAVECRRRASVLDAQIISCAGDFLPN